MSPSYDYRIFFKIDFDRLKLVGIWLEQSKSLSQKCYTTLINTNYFLISLVLILDWIINTRSMADFGLTYIKPICFMAPIKSYLLLSNLKYFYSLFDYLKEELFQPENQEEHNLVVKVLDNFQKRKFVMIFIVGTGIVGSGLYPIFDKERQFPFNAWYPFDELQHGMYEFVYFHQFVCVMLIGGLNMYCDVLLTAMATFVGLQCEVLCLRLGKVGTFSHEKNRPYFIKCVQHHTLILNLLETLNKLFGTIYFWQICFGTMTLCMDLFLLSLSTPNSVEFFYLILYQLAIGNLILVPCWFATEMTRKSEDISMAAYASNWFDFNSNFKKDLAFFIMRSQKPLKLYAANFFEVSVVTFVKIIRSSFSYYAALSNLNT